MATLFTYPMILFWAAALFILLLIKYAFRKPTTRLIPKPLRHTWLAGLGRTVAIALLCAPIFLMGAWIPATAIFMLLIVKFRRESLLLMIDDLRNHYRDGRGLLEHSKDCYMVGGQTATFMKKYLERKGVNPFE